MEWSGVEPEPISRPFQKWNSRKSLVFLHSLFTPPHARAVLFLRNNCIYSWARARHEVLVARYVLTPHQLRPSQYGGYFGKDEIYIHKLLLTAPFLHRLYMFMCWLYELPGTGVVTWDWWWHLQLSYLPTGSISPEKSKAVVEPGINLMESQLPLGGLSYSLNSPGYCLGN